ncbi:DNA cytosine methyltransferase [Citromicrobium bathyomarinum]
MASHTFYEFFAGGGMARAGLGSAWKCLFANDFDQKKAAIYRANWGDEEMWCGDVADVDHRQLPGDPDLVWASFPCQDLSLAGNGTGLNGSRSGAFWPFWNVIEGLIAERRKPRTVVLENVCGLLTSRNGDDFSALCAEVARAGYWLGGVVADAKDFVPQSRPRLFLIAVDSHRPLRSGVQSAQPSPHWHSKQLQTAYARLPTSIQANWLWFCPPTPAKRNLNLADIIEDEPTGICWHSEAETRRLLDMMSPTNRAKVDLHSANSKTAIGAIYKRTRRVDGVKAQRAEVRFDLAGCLRTPGGGSSRQSILVCRDGEIRSRLLSTRETARLMGLSDSYILPERYNDAYHLTGDGVVVPVVRWISQHIIECVLEADLSHEAA